MKFTTLILSLSLTISTSLLVAPSVADAKPAKQAFVKNKRHTNLAGAPKVKKRHNCPAKPGRNTTTPPPPANTDGGAFTLVDRFQGTSFFDGWNFEDFADPTHGQVNYLNRDGAFRNNLSYVQPDNTVVISVDDYTHLGAGQKRNSVRISSKKAYNGGLFVMDAYGKHVSSSFLVHVLTLHV
jgi:hypothetical protein